MRWLVGMVDMDDRSVKHLAIPRENVVNVELQGPGHWKVLYRTAHGGEWGLREAELYGAEEVKKIP